MRSSRVPVTTNTEVFNIFCLRIETFTKIAVALKFSQLENLMQERLFSKKLRIYEFIDPRLPFHRFFKHQSWTTLKPKYWQYFSYLIAEDFENYIICITKSQSCKVFSHYFQLLFRTQSLQNFEHYICFSDSALFLILFLGKSTKEILLMQMANCERTKFQQVQFIT